MQQRQARALGDPSRHTIFQLIAASTAPVDVAMLTAAMHLHHNAVRQHIAKLRDAGLVQQWVDEPHGRGRPRLLYRVAPEVDERWIPSDAYAGLAALLAEAVRTGETAREIGRRAGTRAAVDMPGGADGVEAIRSEASRLGFEPEVHRGEQAAEVVLRNCPFRTVAAADPAVVCDLHLGLSEGIAETVGGVTVERLEVADPGRAGCRLVLETPAPAAGPARGGRRGLAPLTPRRGTAR